MPGFKTAEMHGFLIKPVQRICRYPLLIKVLPRHILSSCLIISFHRSLVYSTLILMIFSRK